jgi:hypothetical protein
MGLLRGTLLGFIRLREACGHSATKTTFPIDVRLKTVRVIQSFTLARHTERQLKLLGFFGAVTASSRPCGFLYPQMFSYTGEVL